MQRNKKFNRIGLLVVCIFLFLNSFSQMNYLSGMIINNQGDTLIGFIDYRNWEKNPKKIKYKTIMDEDPIYYTPTDILGFKVANEHYVSGIVDTEVSPHQTDKLSEDPQLQIRVDTIFLQTLIEGEKSLFYYKNSKGKDNFYIKQGFLFELLVYKKYLHMPYDELLVNENKKYLGQLTLYLKDCSTIGSKLKNTVYNEKSLINLFQYYYQCSSSNRSFHKEAGKITSDFGILAGTSSTSLKFTSSIDGFGYMVKAKYEQSNDFSMGLFLDLVLPRKQSKWSFYNELLLSSYKINGIYEQFEDANKYTITKTDFDYTYLKLNTLLRYKYPVRDMFIFLNGGISNGFAVKGGNNKIIESKFYAMEEVKEGTVIKDERLYEQGLVFGTGIKYKALSFEIRNEQGNGISNLISLNSKVNRYYILLGYKF